MTLKDHKTNFGKNTTARPIIPAKNEIGRISKVILENINKELQNKLQLHHWKNTAAVINWFKKMENKTKYKFMVFDIKDFQTFISQWVKNIRWFHQLRTAAGTNKKEKVSILSNAQENHSFTTRKFRGKRRKTPTFSM